MRNLTLTIHFCDISQSFVSATKDENTYNEPDGIENATHNTLAQLTWIYCSFNLVVGRKILLDIMSD
jgi:hypothetical protein